MNTNYLHLIDNYRILQTIAAEYTLFSKYIQYTHQGVCWAVTCLSTLNMIGILQSMFSDPSRVELKMCNSKIFKKTLRFLEIK